MSKRSSVKRHKSARKDRKRGSSSNNKFSHALQQLRKLNPSQKSQAIGMANGQFIRQMCSHVKKLGYAHVSPKKAKTMKRHTAKLRLISNNKTYISKK